MFIFKNLSLSDKNQSLFFEKDSRPDILECELCKKSFQQLFTLKHKCKRCQRYICYSCGKQKSLVYHRKNIPIF